MKTNKKVKISTVEKDFVEALERLRSRTPMNTELAKKAKLGTLKINFSTVSQEARRSRALIGQDNCAYPKVRMAIKAEMMPVVEINTSLAVIKNLRDENLEMRRKIRLLASGQAAMLRRMEAAEKIAKRKISEIERKRNNNFLNQNRVQSDFDNEIKSVVINFPKNED